jgi:hypothetical protein
MAHKTNQQQSACAILSHNKDDTTLPILQFTRVAASLASMKPLLVDLDDSTRTTMELELLGATAASATYNNNSLPSAEQIE